MFSKKNKQEKQDVHPVTVPDAGAQAKALPDQDEAKELIGARKEQEGATIHNVSLDAAELIEKERRAAKADKHVLKQTAKAQRILDKAAQTADKIKGIVPVQEIDADEEPDFEQEQDFEEERPSRLKGKKRWIAAAIFTGVATLNQSVMDLEKPNADNVIQSLENTGSAISAGYNAASDYIAKDGKQHVQIAAFKDINKAEEFRANASSTQMQFEISTKGDWHRVVSAEPANDWEGQCEALKALGTTKDCILAR